MCLLDSLNKSFRKSEISFFYDIEWLGFIGFEFPVITQAVVTEFTGWVTQNQQQSFLILAETEKSSMEQAADPLSGEGLLSGKIHFIFIIF